MNVSITPATSRRVASGGSMSTAEIKAHIEAMFADAPAPAPDQSGEEPGRIPPWPNGYGS